VVAKVPLTIGSKYLLPKPETKFYVFSNSKYLGETSLSGYKIVPNRFSEDTPTFDIDWNKLNLTKKQEKEAEEDAVLVCANVVSLGGNARSEMEMRTDNQMVEIDEKQAEGTIKRGLGKLKTDECPPPNEYKFDSAYFFKKDAVEFVEMLSTRVCGETTPAIVIVKHDGIVNVIRDEVGRRIVFEQYFQINGRKFVVVNKHEDLADKEAVYELMSNNITLISEYWRL